MKFKIIFAALMFFTFNYSFAQNITPIQIERSQEILQKEEALRQEIGQPQKVFIKDIILPQGFTIPIGELNQLNLRFAGQWLSPKEIQELLDILTQAYQQAYPGSKPPQANYVVDGSKLRIDFEK